MSDTTRDVQILDRAGDFLTTGLTSENTPALQKLSLEIYRALASGAPVTLTALAAKTGLSEPLTATMLAAHPASAIERDGNGAIVAFNGLSLRPTAHHFRVSGNDLYTWCVFDALFLPQVLGKSAKLSTRCPVTDERIEVNVTRDRLDHVEPSGMVMSMVAPDVQACRDDLRGAFCGRVSFYRDEEAFARATNEQVNAVGLDIVEAMALALRRNSSRYPDLVLPTAGKRG